MISGPTAGAMIRSTKFCSSEPGQQVTKMIFAPGLARAREAAADERRDAARRDADDDVTVREAEAADAAAAFLVVVLDAFLGLEHRGLAAGHDRLDEPWRRAERWRHLGGFHHAQPATRPCADEDHAAALAQRLRDDLDAVRDLLFLFLDRGDHLAVLVDDQVDDVSDRRLVDREARGVDLFGGKRLPLGLRVGTGNR